MDFISSIFVRMLYGKHFTDHTLHIGYSMFCDCYGIYTRERSSQVYASYQHKTLYYLFSPNPAVFCVADKQVSHREIYTLCSILPQPVISF